MGDKNYDGLIKQGHLMIASKTSKATDLTLKPGVYIPRYQPDGDHTWFEELSIVTDSILELPSKEFEQITAEMRHFMSDPVKAAFRKYGYVYKRSGLLHGPPGVGKTIIVTRVIKDVVNKGGVVLYVDDPATLRKAYDVLKDISPDVFTLVVFEEFDQMAEDYESDLLSLLDGEVQKDNVIYLGTTNNIELIPARLRRPGRVSSVIEIKYPSNESRYAYFNYKLNDEVLAKKLTEKTGGLSVDELKEVIQAHVILGQELEDVVEKLRVNRDSTGDTAVNSDTMVKEALSDLERLAGFQRMVTIPTRASTKMAIPKPEGIR